MCTKKLVIDYKKARHKFFSSFIFLSNLVIDYKDIIIKTSIRRVLK